MTEETPAPSLADRAVDRLRKLAAGNGLEPDAITVLETQEQVYTLGGKMDVSPSCTTESASYSGGVKGKDRKTVASFAALQQAADAHQKSFRENPAWVAATVKEIKAHENQGWGLEDAKVILPELSATYAATEACPRCAGRRELTCTQCSGQGSTICIQCQGRGREYCYHCLGRGEEPQHPGQPCYLCHGTREAPCRTCQARGQLSCPTCNGRRSIPCRACKASGRTTQEIKVTCGAETHFKLVAGNLPSGLRRGLDRIGINNLAKGHAESITASAPSADDLEARHQAEYVSALSYSVLLPYAELRMSLGNKKAIVSVVGKRCAMSGVPYFLDAPLQPWLDKLHQAALGKVSLESAIEARALRETLSLTVASKGRIAELRKLYPFGLSPAVMTSLLADTQLALAKTTFKIRTAIGLLCLIGSAAAFYYWFEMGFGPRMLPPHPTRNYALAADSGLLFLTLGAGWAVLNFSTRFVLKRRFPQIMPALIQAIGITGYAMLGCIIAVFALSVWLAPIKPLWLALFLRH